MRRLAPADAAAYRALMLEAYDAHPEAFTSTARERAALPLSWWQDRLAGRADGSVAVWGAFDGGRLVGVAGLSRASREQLTHKATLFGMYVQPPFRGRGFGDRLVEELLQYARSCAGLAVVQLTVSDGNHSARALYERHGFAAFGVEPYAVRVAGGYVAKLHMWRHLEPLPRTEPAAPVPLRDVRYQAAVIRDMHLLLVRLHLADGRTFWLLPGGGREPGDRTAEETVRREVREETGLHVTVERLLTDVASPPDDSRYARWRTYLCRVDRGAARPGAVDGVARVAAVLWLPVKDEPLWPSEVRSDHFLQPQLRRIATALM